MPAQPAYTPRFHYYLAHSPLLSPSKHPLPRFLHTPRSFPEPRAPTRSPRTSRYQDTRERTKKRPPFSR